MSNSNPCYAFARKGRSGFDLVLTVKLLVEHIPKLYEDIDDRFIISRLPLEVVRQIHESTGKILREEPSSSDRYPNSQYPISGTC